MALSDEQLLKIFDVHYSFASGHTAVRTRKALLAVEAAVRADQIEKDAAIAESRHDVGWEGHELMTARFPDDGRRVATAIRAQLNGDSNAE